MLPILLACSGDAPVSPSASDDTGATEPEVDCSGLAELPVEPTRLSGFTTSEDFAFDLDGNFVSPDQNGNVLKISYEGDSEVLSPSFGESAGMAYLPSGELVIAAPDRGSLELIAPDGGRTVLLSGLAYPNGVTVDAEGAIYVSELDAGVIRQVDAKTGEYEIVADGLYSPNGLAFGPDERTLYVNSFGGATVHSIERSSAGWEEPVLYGETPTETDTDIDSACEGLAQGDECFLSFGIGIGACEGAPLSCVESLDTDACSGLTEGDGCLTQALGASIESVCAVPLDGGELFCPKVPGEVVSACVGQSDGSTCEALGITRTCDPSWEGILICDITSWESEVYSACEGLASGDDCIVEDYEGYAAGECMDPGHGSMYCSASYHEKSWRGGLDGMAADACGNVYVTEYVMGYIWRFSLAGGEPELVAESNSYWIPNLHWGLGVGGWETDVLYVQERDSRDVLALELGVLGVPAAYRPAD